MTKERTQFCIECREETKYRIERVSCTKRIKDKEYTFQILKAICDKCGEEVNVPGLMDRNAEEIDKQFREMEGLVSIKDINNLMEVYKIGKAPLSLSLGFGEITITRYLAGQIPSKEYSDIIKKALESPVFMANKLQENIDKIGETAYKKSMKAIDDLMPLFSLSEKMLLTISYIFKSVEEITPLALQKMLYYIQGIHMVMFEKELFTEDCQAWVHGPAYEEVYEVFKSFKYNPIDDIRFAMFQNRFDELSDNEKKVIDLVVGSFGMYSGKALEQITHEETPWKVARKNYLSNEPSNEIIFKETIKQYFSEISKQYDLGTVEGINCYINSKLQNA